MSKKQTTIDTYNNSAEALANKFNMYSRVEDITYIFSLISKSNPTVLEIGCGNGRDAEDIIKHTNNYTGVDVSDGLIAIAKKRLPETTFVVADVEEYSFPKGIDVVFAFASLIHTPKESFRNILKRIYESLNEGGVIFISLKYSDEYVEITKEDEFGTRTYWHYCQDDIDEIKGNFKILRTTINEIRGQIWMDVCLKK
jgi:SAM-dependent methyltransferase